MNKNDLILQIDIDKIESKEQFLTFIDVILAHDFVEEYNDCGIIDFLSNSSDEVRQNSVTGEETNNRYAVNSNANADSPSESTNLPKSCPICKSTNLKLMLKCGFRCLDCNTQGHFWEDFA